jgi:iron-sulfur cluster repair protein YtfE (RIC family)
MDTGIGVRKIIIPVRHHSTSHMRHPSLIPLSHDHHHGLALALRCRKQALGRLRPLGAEGLRIRAQEFCEFFHNQLTPHFRAEEEILFPSIREAAPESAPLLDDLLHDHRTFRQLVEKLSAAAGLSKLIFDLGDLLERHIRREERELFPLFEQRVDGSKAEVVGEKIKKILEEKI